MMEKSHKVIKSLSRPFVEAVIRDAGPIDHYADSAEGSFAGSSEATINEQADRLAAEVAQLGKSAVEAT